MELKHVNLLVEAGDIKQVIISKAVMSANRWMVSFERRSGDLVTLTARRDNVRYFATVDSALKLLGEIQIKDAVING